MKLWIASIAPGTSDDEIRACVKKYAPDLESGSIQRIDGDGARPGAMLDFGDTPFGALEKISTRLNAMFGKGRALLVYPQRG